MTLKQALQSRLRIEPGKKVRTFRGWCRRDRVLLDGREIGRIQIRRAPSRTEVFTICGNNCVIGHDVDWLVRAAASGSSGVSVTLAACASV
jgi:hypothetical protein